MEFIAYAAGAAYEAIFGSAATFTASTAAEASLYGAAAETGAAAYGATSTYAAVGAGTSAAAWASYAAQAAQALGGAAAVSSSLNQQEAAKYNAAMSRSNAELAAMQGGAAEEAQRRRAGLILGEQRAAFAQSGVDPNSGSGLLVQRDSARNAELDALTVRYNALLQGRGLLAQSDLDTRQASIYGSNAIYAGLNAGLGTFGAYAAGQGGYLRRGARAGAGYGGGY